MGLWWLNGVLGASPSAWLGFAGASTLQVLLGLLDAAGLALLAAGVGFAALHDARGRAGRLHRPPTAASESP